MSEPWPIHTLVFDLDDTLFTESDYVFGGFRAADKWARRDLGLEGFWPTAENLFKAGHRGMIFNETLEQLGYPAAAEIVGRLVEVYRHHEPQITLSPDAQEALEWARTRFRLVLVSDGYLEVQQRKAVALGLEAIIPKLIFTDTWGREFWKPSPRAFEEVMRVHGGAVGGYVYVADNPRKDFVAPRALGWRTVRIRRADGEHAAYVPSPAEAADIEIRSLTELKGLLLPLEDKIQQ